MTEGADLGIRIDLFIDATAVGLGHAVAAIAATMLPGINVQRAVAEKVVRARHVSSRALLARAEWFAILGHFYFHARKRSNGNVAGRRWTGPQSFRQYNRNRTGS